MKKNLGVKKVFYKDIVSLDKIFRNDKKDYEKKWNMIKKSYNHIYVCKIYVGSIGEFVCRYLVIKKDIKNNYRDFFVFVPYLDIRKELSNYSLLSLFSNEICIINRENLAFWKYVMLNHYSELDLNYYERYTGRRDVYFDVQFGTPLIYLNVLQKKVGKQIAYAMGIKNKYVCFHCRDNNYNLQTLGKEYVEFNDRNSHFSDFSAAIEYLHKQYIQSIRMGKYVNCDNTNVKIIDYAKKYYMDFMDIYLIANCKFYVGTNSGINFVAKIFAKPVLVTNSVYVTVGSGSEINMKENMLIPKKYYSKRSKSFLSLRAIARYERIFADNLSRYKEKDIILIDNTSEEILDAVMEMNERLNGTWKENKEDKFLQEQYQKILKEVNEKNKGLFWNGGGTLYRIGSKYLRENRYLLD